MTPAKLNTSRIAHQIARPVWKRYLGGRLPNTKPRDPNVPKKAKFEMLKLNVQAELDRQIAAGAPMPKARECARRFLINALTTKPKTPVTIGKAERTLSRAERRAKRDEASPRKERLQQVPTVPTFKQFSDSYLSRLSPEKRREVSSAKLRKLYNLYKVYITRKPRFGRALDALQSAKIHRLAKIWADIIKIPIKRAEIVVAYWSNISPKYKQRLARFGINNLTELFNHVVSHKMTPDSEAVLFRDLNGQIEWFEKNNTNLPRTLGSLDESEQHTEKMQDLFEEIKDSIKFSESTDIEIIHT